MTAVNKLLDKARETCSLSSDAALAARLAISRQQLSSWRVGRDPMPEDKIAEIARVARVDPGEWLVLIEAEQARGEARKAYSSLVKRLGIAALLALWSLPGMASSSYNPPAMPIMSTVRKLVTRLQRTLERHRSAPDADLLAL